MAPPILLPERVADLTQAVHVMGSQRHSTLPIEEWKNRGLGEPPRSGSDWLAVLREHPNLFRVNERSEVTLMARHALPATYDPDTGQEVSAEEAKKRREGLHRRPFTQAEVMAQIGLVQQLEASARAEVKQSADLALALRQEKRWFWPVVGTVVGGVLSFLGALAGALIKASQ